MNWCFARINNRLAEIYFAKNKTGAIKFLGHCYVKETGYHTKKGKTYIQEDTAKVKIVYRNGEYKRKI